MKMFSLDELFQIEAKLPDFDLTEGEKLILICQAIKAVFFLEQRNNLQQELKLLKEKYEPSN